LEEKCWIFGKKGFAAGKQTTAPIFFPAVNKKIYSPLNDIVVNRQLLMLLQIEKRGRWLASTPESQNYPGSQ
jgi:hypothetical protein